MTPSPRFSHRIFLTLLLLAAVLTIPTRAADPSTPARIDSPPPAPILGDFDSEIRRPDGHIDIDANLRALKQLGANTYFYLIWHSEYDWDDLPAFAAAAAKEHIDVWVYLIPWSETPLVKKTWGYSEPFRTDYIRWASEIAKLSLAHKNIVGYIIDDFFVNVMPDRFTVPYVRKMTSAARAINPDIKFYALCYFPQAWKTFVDQFAGLVDGVVAAYPKSRLQVGNALAYLNDEAHGATTTIEFPRRTPSQAGDRGSIFADLRVIDPAASTVSFYWDNDNRTEEKGYHMAFVRINGATVWQTDTAGDSEDHVIEISLARYARKDPRVRVEIGVVDVKAVGHYPLHVKFDDIRVTGCDTPSEMASERLWSKKVAGAFEVELLPASTQTGRFKIPMIIMPAGEAVQHEKRYPDPGTPRNVAARTRIGLDLMREGRVQGVVTYCLPKEKDKDIFDAVALEYRRTWKAIETESRRAPK